MARTWPKMFAVPLIISDFNGELLTAEENSEIYTVL